MNGKRITIYDLAKELGISPSYVSRALNDDPAVNRKVKDQVMQVAQELNYKYNSRAANLRQGISKTIGVIVPHIDHIFFSEAIAGIEEVCHQNNHSLIICQSHDLFEKECEAIETLIHQNVDCIIISLSAATKIPDALEQIKKHHVELVQFDRCMDNVDSYKVVNNNKAAAYNSVKGLIAEGYKKIAFVGGPAHIRVFNDRREGYLQAIREGQLTIPYDFIVETDLSMEVAAEIARSLLSLAEPPDAFFCVSDHQALGVIEVAETLGFSIPEQLGIFGFANEAFAKLLKPALSSVDQKSKELGRCAATLYFKKLLTGEAKADPEKTKEITSEILVRQSSVRQKKK